jgi:peptide/nickel transport system substrate-binding protein
MLRARTLRLPVGGAVALAIGAGFVVGAAGPATAAARRAPVLPTLKIAQGIYPETLNADQSTVQDTLNVDTQINEPLLNYNYQTGKIEPNLLTTWKQDGTNAWLFTLRKGVAFTDGEPWNAAAMVWNIKAVLNPATKDPIAGDLALVTGETAVGPYTVKITTKAPNPLLPLSLTRVYILPPKYTQKVGMSGFASRPIGTGPFMFVSAQSGYDVVLKANPHYWGGAPKLGEVIFYAIPDNEQRVQALLTGEVQLVSELTPDLLSQIKANPKLEVVSQPSLRCMEVILDSTKGGPIANTAVRVALNYAIDKQAIVNNLLDGYAKVLDGQLLSPQYFGYDPHLSAYPYDPKKAVAMLKAAGYPPSSLHLTFYAPQGRYMDDSLVAKAIAGQLEKIGIHVNLQVLGWDTYIGLFLKKAMSPLMLIGYSTEPDASYMLDINLTGGVYSYYNNAKFDAIMQKAVSVLNNARRKQLYWQALELQRANPPGIFLYQEDNIYAMSRAVSGFKPSPDERIILQGVSLK